MILTGGHPSTDRFGFVQDRPEGATSSPATMASALIQLLFRPFPD
jgi:hypothetical protein